MCALNVRVSYLRKEIEWNEQPSLVNGDAGAPSPSVGTFLTKQKNCSEHKGSLWARKIIYNWIREVFAPLCWFILKPLTFQKLNTSFDTQVHAFMRTRTHTPWQLLLFLSPLTWCFPRIHPQNSSLLGWICSSPPPTPNPWHSPWFPQMCSLFPDSTCLPESNPQLVPALPQPLSPCHGQVPPIHLPHPCTDKTGP